MVEENRKYINAPMDPTKLLAVYMKKQECCQAFVVDAGNPISRADMVRTGVVHAVATGIMQDMYHDWRCISKPNQSWNHWKEHFNNVFNELKELNAITAESIGYRTSNITENMVATDVAMALNNLTSMAMSKTDALNTLVAVNKRLVEVFLHITKEK